MNVYNSILDIVGRTPLVRLNFVAQGIPNPIYVKLESQNPGGSVKDRIGIAMINAAERDGLLKPGSLIVEPTSGNTGIGIALAARLRGYRCLFVMTDKASAERIRYLKAMGADVLIVSSAARPSSPEYYWNTAQRLANEIPNAVMLNQYDNPANPDIHEQTTGPEIWSDTQGTVTHFVAGIGTGGTISGTGRYLKRQNPAIKVIAADPSGSAIKTYKDTGRLVDTLPYLIEGVGQERIPSNLDLDIVDEVINVSDFEAFAMARSLARAEGIFCGGSSGMNVFVALQTARSAPEGSVIVTVICDTGERYLTKHHSDEWLKEKDLFDAGSTTVKDMLEASKSIAIPPIVSVRPDSSVHEALALMNTYQIDNLPVVSENLVLGLVREARLLSAVLSSRDNLEAPVTSYMDAPPVIIDSKEDISHALELFRSHPMIIVREFGRLCGVLTRHDALRYVV